MFCLTEPSLAFGFVAGVRNVDAPDGRPPAGRTLPPTTGFVRALGVTVLSNDGKRDVLGKVPDGLENLPAGVAFGSGAEASDIGGDGGSFTSETISVSDNDLLSGGVVIRGELAVELGDVSMVLSNVGDPSTERSVEMVERCRDSCFLILSCKSSTSILRSPSSSRSL